MKCVGFLLLSFIALSCEQTIDDNESSKIQFETLENRVNTLTSKNADSALIVALAGFQNAEIYGDYEKCLAHIAVGVAYYSKNIQDSALKHYTLAQELAVNNKLNVLLGKIHNNRGLSFIRKAQLPEAFTEFYLSLRIRKQLRDSLGISRCYHNLGTAHNKVNKKDSALFYLHESLKLKIEQNNIEQIGNSWLAIGNVFLEMDSNRKAIKAYQKAKIHFKKANLKINLGILNINMAALWLNSDSAHSSDSALKEITLSKKLFLESGTTKYNTVINDIIGHITYNSSNLDKAKEYFKASYAQGVRQRDVLSQIVAKIHIAQVYDGSNEKDSCLISLHEVRQIARKAGYTRYLNESFKLLSEHHEIEREHDSSLIYLKKYNTLNDSLLGAKVRLNIEAIQAKFNVKQEKLKTAEQKLKTRRLVILSISLSAVVIIAILIIVIFRQRLKSKTQLADKNEELHQQKIDELMKEKQLERLTALMEGQEQERAKIAADLHDGVGSLLSTVKHHFQVVEDKMDKGAGQMDKAQTLLDEACDEVRRISHDMASNVLSKFGLVAALQDLAESISSSEKLKLELIATGIDERLENSKEIHLFRIVQELIGNTLKHAKASKASIQLTRHDNELNLIVEDNGVGFNPEEAESSSGMGLENLKTRVKHLDGHISFDSTHGKGTTVVVDIPFTS